MLALTPDERNAVIHGIIRDLGTEQALALFERPQTRRRLVDYAVVADELGFGGPLRTTYPVERALPALRRVLTEWRNTANDWRRLHAELDGRNGAGELDGVRAHTDYRLPNYRLEIWAECRSILDKIGD
jgi:hypothetical protein